MADTKYTYSISTDFPKQQVASTALTAEIRASAITIAVARIDTAADDCDIWFRAELSVAEKTTLDGLVAAHQGQEAPSGDPILGYDATSQQVRPVLTDSLGRFVNAAPINPQDRIPLVAIAGREGSEIIYSTHNLCDRTSWYGDSARVTGEELVDSGDGQTFTSDHSPWIDMVHGKVQDEDGVSLEIDHGYAVRVFVDSIEATMREPFEDSGGDYEVNYADGKVVFFASQAEKTITADYSYAQSSLWVLAPSEGRFIDIQDAEIQFSADVDFRDTIQFQVVGLVDVFAPEMMPGVPSGTKIPLQTTAYKTISQMLDEAKGSYPTVPATGNTSGRGLASAMTGMPFIYNATRRLTHSYGMELQISLKHDRPFGGFRATGTFYAISRLESSLGQ